MENLETSTEMVVETTKKSSKGFIVGGLVVSAIAAVATVIYKKFKKHTVEQPSVDEEVFEGINEEI